MAIHHTHKTRSSDASTFDIVCKLCGVTDGSKVGNILLSQRCLKSSELASKKIKQFIEFDDAQKFWLVWGEQTERVTKKQTFGTAMKEAERLSKKHKGQRFYVLKAQHVFQETIDLDTPISLAELQMLPKDVVDELTKKAREHLTESIKQRE